MEITINTFKDILDSHDIRITKQTLKRHLSKHLHNNKKGEYVINYDVMLEYLKFYKNNKHSQYLLLVMEPKEAYNFLNENISITELTEKIKKLSRSSIYHYIKDLNIKIKKIESFSFIKREDIDKIEMKYNKIHS